MENLDKNYLDIVEKFNNSQKFEEEMQYFPSLLELFEDKGPSNFRLYFWRKASLEKKEAFIRALFNHLITLSSNRKLELLKLVRNLFIDSEPDIKKQFIMIIYSALFEKINFKITLMALDFLLKCIPFLPMKKRKRFLVIL